MILYKYRNWLDPYHRKLITSQELFFASPSSFNDPFDFQITYRYDLLSREERILKYQKGLSKQGISGNQLNSLAESLADSGKLNNPDHLKKTEQYQRSQMNTSYGVVSLSSEPKSILMWSHYALNHQGFCIGFNTNKLRDTLQPILVKVLYLKDYPIIIPTDSNSSPNGMIAIMGSKHINWRYEKEYRLVKFGYSNKVIKLSKEHFKSIIFGCTMPKEHKEEIAIIIKKELPNVKIYETLKHNFEYKLLINEYL